MATAEVHVQVLLATYNGAEFLEEYLQSLLKQEQVVIDLLVSDDGSTDGTLDLLNEYKNEFGSFSLLSGPGLGPKANFEFLIKKSEGPFIALADQDDIWYPSHLINSIGRLREVASIPALSFSSALEFGKFRESDQIWPTKIDVNRFENVFLENLARGCTVVINSELAKIARNTSFSSAIMHDWWLLLIARSCGVVKFSDVPEVRYRLHSSNFIGTPRGKIVRALKLLAASPNKGKWLPAEQLRSLEIQVGRFMNPSELEFLVQFNRAISGRPIARLRYFLFCRHNFRRNRIENFILRIYLGLSLPK